MVCSVVGSVAGPLIRAISDVCKIAVTGLKIIGNAILSIGKTLGIVKTDDVEDLGDKALQAEDEGIKPENYDTYEEYAKTIDAFEINPEKSKQYSPEEKIAKGMDIGSEIIVEKMPEVHFEDLYKVLEKIPDFFDSAETVKAFVGLLHNGDVGKTAFTNIVDYVLGKLDPSKFNDTINSIVEIEKTVNPEISDRDAKMVAMDLHK